MFPRTILTTTDPLYVHNLTYVCIGTSTRGPQWRFTKENYDGPNCFMAQPAVLTLCNITLL
jgi:hypothetical protein